MLTGLGAEKFGKLSSFDEVFLYFDQEIFEDVKSASQVRLITTNAAKHMIGQAQMNEVLRLADHTEITNEDFLSKLGSLFLRSQ